MLCPPGARPPSGSPELGIVGHGHARAVGHLNKRHLVFIIPNIGRGSGRCLFNLLVAGGAAFWSPENSISIHACHLSTFTHHSLSRSTAFGYGLDFVERLASDFEFEQDEPRHSSRRRSWSASGHFGRQFSQNVQPGTKHQRTPMPNNMDWGTQLAINALFTHLGAVSP